MATTINEVLLACPAAFGHRSNIDTQIFLDPLQKVTNSPYPRPKTFQKMMGFSSSYNALNLYARVLVFLKILQYLSLLRLTLLHVGYSQHESVTQWILFTLLLSVLENSIEMHIGRMKVQVYRTKLRSATTTIGYWKSAYNHSKATCDDAEDWYRAEVELHQVSKAKITELEFAVADLEAAREETEALLDAEVSGYELAKGTAQEVESELEAALEALDVRDAEIGELKAVIFEWDDHCHEIVDSLEASKPDRMHLIAEIESVQEETRALHRLGQTTMDQIIDIRNSLLTTMVSMSDSMDQLRRPSHNNAVVTLAPHNHHRSTTTLHDFQVVWRAMEQQKLLDMGMKCLVRTVLQPIDGVIEGLASEGFDLVQHIE